MISDHADPLVQIGSKESGGQNIYVYYLSRFLARKGIYVDVYTRWDRSNKKEIVKYNSHVRVIRVKAGPKKYIPRDNFLSVLTEFEDNILNRIKKEKLKYEVIHSNYWFSGLAGLRISKEIKAPLIHVFHSIGKVRFNTLKKYKIQKKDYDFYQKRISAEQKIANESETIIATSPVEKQILIRHFKIKADKIKFIPIGVDFNIFRSKDQEQARKKINMPIKNKAIVYVGRLEWRKGIGTLLYSLKKIPKTTSFSQLVDSGRR
jgi:glycosyltransferase involved in cell wall biosynthesis